MHPATTPLNSAGCYVLLYFYMNYMTQGCQGSNSTQGLAGDCRLRAHVDEEAALSQCARSIAGGRSQLLGHEVIGAPAGATEYRLTELHSRAERSQHT